jgi:hypothetical protein
LVDELLTKQKLSPGGLQLSLLLIIQRHTWGAIGRPAWAKLSITKLAQMCSSGRGASEGYTPRAVATALNDMMSRGIIAGKNAKGQPLRGALSAEERETTAKSTAAAMYQSTPAGWRSAPKYVAPEIEEHDALEAEEAEETTVEHVEPGDPIIVMPGARSKPMPMRIAIRGREPVDVRWRAVNSGTSALTCLVRPDAAGLLTFTVSEKGEAKANDYSSRLRKFAATAGIDEPGPGTPRREELYRKYMQELMLRVWKKPADADFIVRVISESKGAPVDCFERIVESRIAAAVKRKASFTNNGLQSGILIELAKDAAKVYTSHVKMERETLAREEEERATARDREREAEYWSGDDDSAWSLVRKALKSQISDAAYVNWFSRTRYAGWRGKVMLVAVPDEATAAYLDDEYGQVIGVNARAVRPGLEGVRFVVRERVKGAAA